MMLYEQYNKSNEIEKLRSRIQKIWDNHDAMSVKILSGYELSFNPRNGISEDDLVFSVFNDMYMFKRNAWGGTDIYRSDNGGNEFDTELNNDEIYEVIQNTKILLNFYKLYSMRKTHDTTAMVRELTNFFEIYDATNPDNFYKEYLDHFKDNPEYISLVDWSQKDIEKMTEDEKNLVMSAKGAKKYNIF